MITHLIAFAAGGAVVYLCPKVAARGASIYRSLKQFWDRIGQ